MGKKSKKERKKQQQQKPKYESESDSEPPSELDENFTLSDVLKVVDSHKTWHDLLRDERLFEAGIFETDFNWVKEVWKTRKDKSQPSVMSMSRCEV